MRKTLIGLSLLSLFAFVAGPILAQVGSSLVSGNIAPVYLTERSAAAGDVAGYGQLWIKDDTPNTLLFTDDAGVDQVVGGIPVYKSYTFVARDAAAGANFQAGFYNFSTADANLLNGGATVTHGGANVPYAAHAFIVSGGNGTTDGSDLVLTVTGTSITDAGVRDSGGTEVIEATAAVSALHTYFETTLKWIGTITYTLTSAGGSAFTYDFNYGFTKYEDFGNRDFTVTDLEVVGLANQADGGFEIELLHHTATGWTYHVDAFVAGNTPLLSMNTIHSTEQDLDAGEPFAFKRSGLSTAVDGNGGEGVLVRITTAANNSVSYMDTHIGVVVQ